MWVVVALGVLAALTALVLSVPVDLGLRVEVYGRSAVQLRVVWLFGLVQKTFRSGAGTSEPEEKAAIKPDKKPEARKRATARKAASAARAKGSLAWQIVRVPGMWRSVLRLVCRMCRCIRLKTLRSDFQIDLADPVHTALVVGGLSQAALMADVWTRHSFRITPSFLGDAILTGEADVAVRVRPLCTVPPLLRFVFSLSMLRTLVLLVRFRCRKDR